MIRWESIFVVYFLFLPSSVLFAQTISYYIDYRTSFPLVTTCSIDQYFDTALLRCSPCPANAQHKLEGKIRSMSFETLVSLVRLDITQCECRNNTFYNSVNQGGGSLICEVCTTGTVCRDSWECF